MIAGTVLDGSIKWLLEGNQPSIRFLTLTQLLGRDPKHSETTKTKERILTKGWVRRLLSNQREGCYWENPMSCYYPKFVATVWHLQLMAVLGADGNDPRIRASCERFLAQHTMRDGGFACGVSSGRYSEECLTGRMIAILLQFGYRSKDPRIENAVGWLLQHQLRDGGWNCYRSPTIRHSSLYSTFMALWGFSRIPARQRSREVGSAVDRGVAFMLAHRLFKSHRTGKIINKRWLDFNFPPNVRYDVLHSLRLLTDLGVVSDERLADSLELVESRAQRNGRWLLDGVPRLARDPSGTSAIELEKKGRASKWVTLNALVVLSKTGRLRLPRNAPSAYLRPT